MNSDELSILKSTKSNIDTNYLEYDNFTSDTEKYLNDTFSLNLNDENYQIFLQKMYL